MTEPPVYVAERRDGAWVVVYVSASGIGRIDVLTFGADAECRAMSAAKRLNGYLHD